MQTSSKKVKDFQSRIGHSALIYESLVIVFGGMQEKNILISNDLFILSLNGEQVAGFSSP